MTQPFHFPDGRLANDANDLIELCKQYPNEATNFLVRQDLEKWLAYIGNYDLAECAANARQTDIDDRQKLEEFLERYNSVTAPQPVPVAVTETNIKDNLTAPESATVISDPEPKTTTPEPAEAETELEPATPPQQPVSAKATPPQKPAAETTANTDQDSEEKPSFFQVVAKFIIKILFRNKA